MPGLTARLKLPWAKLEEAADIETAIKPLAESLDTAALTTVTGGPPPAQPQPAGNLHFRSDNRVLYVSDGANWWPIIAGGSAPISQVAAFASANVVDVDGQVRWLLCNGSPQSSAAYPALFQAITTTYGTGDGGGNDFSLPDFRGRVPVGMDSGAARVTANNTLGKSGGVEKHALSLAQIPSHSHRADNVAGVGGYTTGMNRSNPHGHTVVGAAINVAPVADTGRWSIGHDNGAQYAMPNSQQGIIPTDIDHEHPIYANGGNADHPNLPPYQVVNWFIKAKY
jgi:microcystin-dependent protein